MKIHNVEILICDDCVHLRGEMCHVPECVFCRRTMTEVKEILNLLNICPIINGVRHILVGNNPISEAEKFRDSVPYKNWIDPRRPGEIGPNGYYPDPSELDQE